MRIVQLLNMLDFDISLPYPLPKTDKEKKANNYSITTILADRQDQDIDPEDKAYVAGQMCTLVDTSKLNHILVL